MSENGLCECGCGLPAPIAKRKNSHLGHVTGKPVRFIAGHNYRGKGKPRHGIPIDPPQIKLCECGCGTPTNPARRTDAQKGWFKGVPLRFVVGHNRAISRGQTRTPTYASWEAMIARVSGYGFGSHRYSGRGITVCDRWRKFDNFLADMGERPRGMTLDRINNDGSYCPENCRWATKEQQENNKSTNVLVTHNGETLSIKQWSRRLGISPTTLYMRHNHLGWRPPELFKPVKPRATHV